MAFSADITIADSTPANQTYSLLTMDGSKTLRKNTARALETPCIMTVSHTVQGKAAGIRDRHLVRFDLTELDTDGITPYSGAVYLVLDKPRRAITDAQIYDLVVQMKNYLTSGNVTKVLNGEPG